MPARRNVLIVWLAASLLAAPFSGSFAQAPATPRPVRADGEDRAALVAERYKEMLAANPVEGISLDRLWKSYENRGATDRLLEDYRQASQHPTAGGKGNPALIYGHLLKKAGRLDEAAAAYRQAVSFDASGPLPVLALAELAGSRGKPADAAGFYEQTLSKLPPGDSRRSELLLKLGGAWLAAGQPAKAAQQWKAAVALDPNNLSLRRELAANDEKNNFPERAIGQYEYIVQHGGPAEQAQALRDLGRLHQARDEFDPARDAFERGLVLTSRENWLHAELESQLIRLYQRTGRASELESRWQAAVTANPRDLGGYQRLEHLAEAQADAAGERAALQKIIALTPRDRESTLKLARLLTDAGEREPAAALYDQLLKLQPENLELILARADLDLQLGRPAAAVERIEARVARSPADESVTSPALAFFLGHHLDEAAERRLRDDLARQPASDDPALALVKFLHAQHQPAQARAVLETLANRPGDAAARAARLLRVADAYKEQNAPEDALRCWKVAAELQPQLPAPLLGTADLLLARGDAAGARVALAHAVDITPAGPERIEVERKLFQALQSEPAGTGGDLAPRSRSSRRRAPVSLTIGPVVPPGASPLGMDRAPAESDSPAPPLSPEALPLANYLDGLDKAAKAEPTAANHVRLARWLQWGRDLPGATAAAENAARLDPRDLPSRELLASLSLDAHQHEAAERWLREILAIDPDRKAACLKQIANLKLEEGDYDNALTTFDKLRRDAPGSVAALSDLALAQQRADHWFDALATWEQAYALPGATLSQRAEIRRPLLVALEKLDRFLRAAEVLQSAIDEQPDVEARQDLFRELTAFCRQHGLADTLRTEYEARLKARPQDYFLLAALAEMRRAAGHEREAYRLLAQAYYSAPDPARSLRGLADAAESLGAIDEAVVHQRRLAALPGQATVETLERLASLEDGGSQVDASTRTWENIVARFPRDPLALAHAETFFEAAGKTGRARELLDQLVRINAADNRQLLHLGELNAAASDVAGARAAFDQVLARTEPEKAGSPLVLPDDLDKLPPLDAESDEFIIYRRTFRPAGGFAVPAATALADDADTRLRLRAIGGISRLLFSGSSPALNPAQQAWLARWQEAEKAGGRSEALWASYHAGQKDQVMDTLARWFDEEPAKLEIHQGLLGLGLRLGAYRRIASWVWSPDERGGGSHRRSLELVQMMAQWLGSPGARGDANLVADLFPPEVKARDSLWLVAKNVFAARQRYAEAIGLGTRLFDTSSTEYRPTYGQELAHWELYLGHADRARAILRRVLEQNESDTLDPSGSGVFAILREYYLLLPEGERRPFAEEYLAWTRKHAAVPHAVLTGVILHGLLGDEPAAQRDLDALLKMRLLTSVPDESDVPLDPRRAEESRAFSEVRRWSYLSVNGSQLQSWNLAPLAVYLWRHALGNATAFDRRLGSNQQSFVDLRNQLLLAEVETAPGPQVARELVDDYLRTRPSAGGASAVAGQLAGGSRFAEAARVGEYLCQIDPDAPDHWQERFTALEAAGDTDAAVQLCRGLLENKEHFPAGLGRAQIVRQLAGLLENEAGNVEGARQYLWRERKADRGTEFPILSQLAQSYERTGQWEEAARVWREASDDPTGNAALAVARIDAQHLGRLDEALASVGPLVERSASESEHARFAVVLAGLQVAAGHADEAVDLGFGLLHDNQPAAAATVAINLAAHGEAAVARQLLVASVRRTHDPRTRLQQQKVLVEMLAAEPGNDPVFERELRRLRVIADETTPLRAVFDDVRFDLARKRHMDAWLEGELLHDWQDGRGSTAAGEDLARLYLETHQDKRLEAVIPLLLKHPSAGEPMLAKLQKSLAAGGQTTLAAAVSQALVRNYPQNDAYGLAYARDLWKGKHTNEAREVLASLASASPIRENICARLGETCLELGDKALARKYLEQAVAQDPLAVRTPQAWLQLADLDMDAGRLAEARRDLRAAYRNPACAEVKPLVRYLTGAIPRGTDHLSRLGGRDFPLAAGQQALLLPALVDTLRAAERGEDARALVEAHPEWLTLVPSLVGKLFDVLPSGDKDGLARLMALVEGAVTQAEPPCPALNRQLALLYTKGADQDAAAALAHLARAHALDPANFPIANRLAHLQMDRKQDTAALETLRGFLSVDALPEEHAEAAKTLRRG